MKYFSPQSSEDIAADLANLVRIGTVTEVDMPAARCVVRYGDPDDDEPAQTPPIRWLAPRAGQTRVWSAPSVGEQVILLSPDSQVGNAVALMGLVQDAFPPLGSTGADMIEFKDGARITYDPDAGQLRAVLPEGATAEIDAPGGITLRGDVTIEGNLSVSKSASIDETLTAGDDVIADDISLTGHLHGLVKTGTDKSGAPE